MHKLDALSPIRTAPLSAIRWLTRWFYADLKACCAAQKAELLRVLRLKQ